MSTAGSDNADTSPDNIFFTIKDTKLYVSVVTLSAKNYQNFLGKDLKDQFIGMHIRQKLKIKAQRMNIGMFLKHILL